MDSYALLEPHQRAYSVTDLSLRLGLSRRVIREGIARHRAWLEQTRQPGASEPWPTGAIAAIKVRGRWLVPLGAALRLADPARFDREAAARQAEQLAQAQARAEALDAVELVDAARAAVERLLPGVEIVAEPIVSEPGSFWFARHRFMVGLREHGRNLVATSAWTVGAALPRLLDAASVERLRRDVAAAGWMVRTEPDLTHGIFATTPAGIGWYLDLPADDETDFFRGPRGVAEVAWDYGAQGGAIVPTELLGEGEALAAFLEDLRAPGLMSAEQAARVAARLLSPGG